MIQKLVALALRMPFIVLAGAVTLIAAGLVAYSNLDIEAYPNPVPPMVELITQPDGWSAEEVERYVTVPLEIGLAGMPALDHIRSQSLFELSDVKCYFTWATTFKDARQEVINRIQFVQLPTGMQAQLSPWNAIGELFRYNVVGKGYTTQELKTAEDWILERQFKQVPGVIDVTSFGGETKQYHVEVDPYRLRGQGVSLTQLTTALQNANQNVGGQRLDIGEQAYTVRGVGLIKSRRPRHRQHRGDRAEGRPGARAGHRPHRRRRGAAPRASSARTASPTSSRASSSCATAARRRRRLKGIYERLDFIKQNHILPPGMEIVPYYDRGNLVKLTTHTVIENLVVGMVLVSIVLFVFLGHGRAALVTAINIPMALMIAFCGLVATRTQANLISLGAVDFGIVVDSTVIMMENIFRHLGAHGKGTMQERILAAAREVAGPMTFSTVIIGIAFLPLFTMTGVAGVIFSPMATTYAFAIGGAIFLALTLTPVLASKVIPKDTEEKENFIMRGLHRAYAPAFDLAMRHTRMALVVALLPIGLCAILFPLLGGEFMPKLEEGNFWIRATLPTSISLAQSEKYVGRMRSILRGCPDDPKIECDEKNAKNPEVLTVVSQLGRPDDGTDVAGFNNIELFAPLKPFDDWRRGMTKEKLTDQLNAEMAQAFPGVVFNFSQMISDNVEEAVAGVKGENSVKVFGPNVRTNEENAQKIIDIMSKVDGVKDLGLFSSLGQPNVKITPDRRECARYGLNTGDVEQMVQAAVGGQAITQVLEGERRFDLTVRWLEPYRTSLEAIREITVSTPDGASIPLGQIATVKLEEGAVGHLPRGRAALCAGQVQRPREGSREHHQGGQAAHRKRAAPPVRLAHLLGRGDQPAQRGEVAPPARRADDAAPHRLPRLRRGPHLDRHAHRRHLHPGRLHRRRARAASCRDALLGVGGDGVHLHLRHRHPGRHPRGDVLPASARGRGARHRAGGARGRREALPPGTDDHAGGDAGPPAGGALERHRVADPEAAGHRGHRRVAHPRGAHPRAPAAAARAGAYLARASPGARRGRRATRRLKDGVGDNVRGP